MIEFNKKPEFIINTSSHPVYVFSDLENNANLDKEVVKAFGDEWTKFNSFSDSEIQFLGSSYFDILDDQMINGESTVVDFGAGSGRFSKYLSGKVKFIELLEPSDAAIAASNLLKDIPNVRISKAAIGSSPFEDETFDFGMSIGVLHHMPDTFEGMKYCVRKIKMKGWFYVYLYYNLDNKGVVHKIIFFFVDLLRRVISILPAGLKKIACDVISITVYAPIIYFGKALRHLGLKKIANKLPLNYYQITSFQIIRNDALDRFGTRLEKRFSKKEIKRMMEHCGLTDIRISSNEPFWHAVGQKTSSPKNWN